MKHLVGRKIKSIRLDKGMTTEDFAELFNPPATKGTVSKWENGKYLPNPKRLQVIAELGNTTVEDLLAEDCKMCTENDYKADWYPDNELELSAWFSVTSDRKIIITLSNPDDDYLGFIDIDISYCPNCGRRLPK